MKEIKIKDYMVTQKIKNSNEVTNDTLNTDYVIPVIQEGIVFRHEYNHKRKYKKEL